MGRAPCCDKEGVKKGPWTPEEDQTLTDYIKRHGHGSWRSLPKRAGLLRCGKSCRLRWTNYLRPDIKRGNFSVEEEQTIIGLHGVMGNKWSAIASQLPGRTDNEIKNYWNTHLKKRLLQMGIDPVTHRPRMDLFDFSNPMAAPWENARLQEVLTREYYIKIVAAAMLQQQHTDAYNHENAGSINALENQLRSQPEYPLCSPDFTPNPIISQICSQHREDHQAGSLDYDTLVPQALEQLQSQNDQIMKNIENFSHTSTLHGLNSTLSNIKLENQDNNNATHTVTIINDQLNLIPDPKFLAHNSSLAYNASPSWLEENNMYGISRSTASKSLPPLASSTSSSKNFNDSCDFVGDASSSMLDKNTSSTHTSSATTSSKRSYVFPPEFLLDITEVGSQQTQESPDMQKCEDGRDYWSDVLNYVSHSTVNDDSSF